MAGAVLYGDWSAEAEVVALMLPAFAFAYLIFPALGGARLAVVARGRFGRRG